MKKVDWRSLNIEPHEILVAHTSEPDYSRNRKILLQMDYATFVYVEGWHCSCYGFDDTEWEAIEYEREELEKLVETKYNAQSGFWQEVKMHLS